MWCVASRPIDCQVVPPSTDLKTPNPASELRAISTSPVPIQTTFGSLGAMAMSPMLNVGWWVKTGCQVMPAFVVFQTLPDPAPTNHVSGRLGCTASASMRPP